MKYIYGIFISVLIVFALINVTVQVGGQEETSDETSNDNFKIKEKEKRDAYKREFVMEKKDHEFKVKSKLKVGDQKDEIVIEFKAEEKAEIKIKYKNESDSLETKLEYRVKFDRIIEYIENDQPGYQEDEDVFLSEYKFKEWDNIIYDVSLIDGEEVNIINASTSDGMFTLVLRYAGSILDLADSDATLTPNSIKIDVIINDYSYTDSDSSLALRSKIQTKAKTEQEHESDEEEAGFAEDESQVAVALDSFSGFYSWADFAFADGVQIDVVSSSLLDDDEDEELEVGETSQKLYFSFITTDASEIVWDPKLGVVSQGTHDILDALNTDSDDASLPGFNIWMAIVSISIIALIKVTRLKRLR